jgi:imidazolonepropionase-like amidohydrolase
MSRGIRLLVAVLSVSAALASVTSSAATLIHAGRVIDGVSERVLSERTIVVDGGRIVAIESGYRAPAAGDAVIDLRSSTLMPGLMDMHVHLTSEYSRSSAGDAAPQAAATAPVKVTSQEQFAKLPKGTTFVAPDGSIRIKP